LDAYRAGPVVLAWPALLGFLRPSTRAGLMVQSLTVTQALGVMQRWLGHPATTLLHPTPQHAVPLGSLTIGAGRGGALLSDAHLATLAIERGATMLSFDRDFARFAGLRFKHLT
jgi:uncharacterized protein